MDRKQLTNDLRTHYGLMLSVAEATMALGFKDRKATIRFLDGLQRCDMGKEKKYVASDIAKRIEERME